MILGLLFGSFPENGFSMECARQRSKMTAMRRIVNHLFRFWSSPGLLQDKHKRQESISSEEAMWNTNGSMFIGLKQRRADVAQNTQMMKQTPAHRNPGQLTQRSPSRNRQEIVRGGELSGASAPSACVSGSGCRRGGGACWAPRAHCWQMPQGPTLHARRGAALHHRGGRWLLPHVVIGRGWIHLKQC